MNIRKNVRSLTPAEVDTLVHALLELKRCGQYDTYSELHHHAVKPTVMPWEPRDPAYRNHAHRGPGFLPWHRVFLQHVENDLKSIDASINLPYWDWTEDEADPAASPLWADSFFGGSGVESDYWRVADGPFAFSKGNWDLAPIAGFPERGLKRQLGKRVASLPTRADVLLVMRESLYDAPPYNASPFSQGFRSRLEGWISQRGDPQVSTSGSQLHNRVHGWVGGNMTLMTSPDDPLFFLHHAFIDKIWADWQAHRAKTDEEWTPHYAPLEGGPRGHNFEDRMTPWKRRISDVMDIGSLGYAYEASPSPMQLPPDTPSPFEF